jgi:hypothetical protein
MVTTMTNIDADAWSGDKPRERSLPDEDGSFPIGMYARVDVWNDPHAPEPARSSGWSERELGNENWGKILDGLFEPSRQNADNERTLTDSGGNNRTVAIKIGENGNTLDPHFWNDNPDEKLKLAYGNGGASPSRTDTTVSGEQVTSAVDSSTLDIHNTKLDVSMQYEHDQGSMDITNVGLYIVGNYGGASLADFLLDHASVTATSVTDGDIVAITYAMDY